MNVSLENLRGHTFDGARDMLGYKSRVSKQISVDQPKALVTHCYGHSLNLSVKDLTKQCKLIDDVMATVGEITILVKYSHKRQ